MQKSVATSASLRSRCFWCLIPWANLIHLCYGDSRIVELCAGLGLPAVSSASTPQTRYQGQPMQGTRLSRYL